MLLQKQQLFEMWNLGHWATTCRSPTIAMQATEEEESVSASVSCAKICNQAKRGFIGVFKKNLIGEKLAQLKASIDPGSTHFFIFVASGKSLALY